jgi:hypothetical protein
MYHMKYRDQVVRRCRFTPYLKGLGPTFSLEMWDTYRMDTRLGAIIGYRLTMKQPGKRAIELFKAEDYSTNPSTAIDSDSAVGGLMCFLTLRPGDTDSDYFKDYTPTQLDYCNKYAETLGYEVMRRFGRKAK